MIVFGALPFAVGYFLTKFELDTVYKQALGRYLKVFYNTKTVEEAYDKARRMERRILTS